jgi:ribosomal protein S18 acetylase RimI-like enzyme
MEGEDVGMISTAGHEKTVELVSVRVAPAFQRRGIGTRLVEEILAEARRQRLRVELSVLKTNPKAKKFYERLGFVVAGETKTHYRLRTSV